jgi:hypothetical protein
VVGDRGYLTDYSTGLLLIDLADPADPQIIASLDTPGGANGVAVSYPYAFLAEGFSGLQVIDISDPASPAFVADVPTTDAADGRVADACVCGMRAGRLR